VAVGIRLLHDLVVHELLNLLLGEAMHQLAGLVRRLEVLAALAYFVDMHLNEISLVCRYNGLAQLLPLAYRTRTSSSTWSGSQPSRRSRYIRKACDPKP
jgi:hypothetical protein